VGLLINSSRAIIYASNGADFAKARRSVNLTRMEAILSLEVATFEKI
jgi:hypothetical protein